jgi:hypothetical protein
MPGCLDPCSHLSSFDLADDIPCLGGVSGDPLSEFHLKKISEQD